MVSKANETNTDESESMSFFLHGNEVAAVDQSHIVAGTPLSVRRNTLQASGGPGGTFADDVRGGLSRNLPHGVMHEVLDVAITPARSVGAPDL